jgi:hypothetical protein
VAELFCDPDHPPSALKKCLAQADILREAWFRQLDFWFASDSALIPIRRLRGSQQSGKVFLHLRLDHDSAKVD